MFLSFHVCDASFCAQPFCSSPQNVIHFVPKRYVQREWIKPVVQPPYIVLCNLIFQNPISMLRFFFYFCSSHTFPLFFITMTYDNNIKPTCFFFFHLPCCDIHFFPFIQLSLCPPYVRNNALYDSINKNDNLFKTTLN